MIFVGVDEQKAGRAARWCERQRFLGRQPVALTQAPMVIFGGNMHPVRFDAFLFDGRPQNCAAKYSVFARFERR
ncbi:hypothetical protein BCEN4_350170 [Burkholderia cenocepacia]|nr:hypothetical protein BCEN4_350170 [Burkholderia cenocepacia]